MGKSAISVNYFSSKAKCYTTLFQTLIKKSKVAKILIFNPEFFQVLPVSMKHHQSFQNSTVSYLYLHIGTISTESSKMKFHSLITSIILIIACACKILTVDIKPELKSNV